MEHLVGNLMKTYHGETHSLTMFAPVTDSHRLDSYTKEGIDYIKEHAFNYKNFVFQPLSATLFMNFKRTGNRVDYEDIFFGKRRALNALVMAEYVQNDGQYLDDIINGIFSICEESTWVLPPHNSYIRDTPQLILPDSDRPVLDLFACETGAQLATIYQLLKPSLDNISPFICKRILSELQKRIITPYLTEHFWWMGKEDEPMCNWTIWCTQNILLTASQIPLDSDCFHQIVAKAADSTDFFLKEYGLDGCCDEGAQYYHHSGLCLFFTLDLLNHICEDAFISLWNHEKIRNIAEYICNVHVEGPYYVNFADCSPIAGRAGVREYLFGKAVHSDPLCSFAALDYVADGDLHMQDEINLSYHLLDYRYEGEIKAFAVAHPNQIPAKNVWYESVGIFIARTQESCLAVKAGDNDDSHNHNDTGSVIFYHQGKPVLVDIGVESYTLKTFSPQRYEIWTMQSGYHNLPTLDGYDQQPGKEYCAKEVCVSLADEVQNEFHADCSEVSAFQQNLSKDLLSDCGRSTSMICMDIVDAYPAECGIPSYRREVSLTPGCNMIASNVSTHNSIHSSCEYVMDQMFLKDTISNPDGKEVILNFITYDKPVFQDNILTIGNLYRFQISAVADCKIEELPITDPRLQICWKHSLYRIRFTVTTDTFEMYGVI